MISVGIVGNITAIALRAQFHRKSRVGVGRVVREQKFPYMFCFMYMRCLVVRHAVYADYIATPFNH